MKRAIKNRQGRGIEDMESAEKRDRWEFPRIANPKTIGKFPTRCLSINWQRKTDNLKANNERGRLSKTQTHLKDAYVYFVSAFRRTTCSGLE